jgi:hypothetical protein
VTPVGQVPGRPLDEQRRDLPHMPSVSLDRAGQTGQDTIYRGTDLSCPP